MMYLYILSGSKQANIGETLTHGSGNIVGSKSGLSIPDLLHI